MSSINSLNQTAVLPAAGLRAGLRRKTSRPATSITTPMLVWLDRELDPRARASNCRDIIRALPAQPSPGRCRPAPSRCTRVDSRSTSSTRSGPAHIGTRFTPRTLRSSSALSMTTYRAGHLRPRDIASPGEPLTSTRRPRTSRSRCFSLYKAAGAHAAAAEQYAHYAAVMRAELGVEPPPLESL